MLRRIWVDSDVALGAARGDVDDGFALAALLSAHRRGIVDLLGISTVFGNTTAALAQECAQELCHHAGVSVTILRGAERASQGTAASERIAALEPAVELLCLGPLTNVAAACARNSELPGATSLSAVGGNLSSRGVLPPFWPFEFNFARDRDSARFVLSQSWTRLTLYPLDVVRRLEVGALRLEHLASVGQLGAHLARQSGRWLSRARWRYLGSRFPIWDLPAALDLAGALIGTRERRRLSLGTRWLVATSRPIDCLVSFDAGQAWESFEHLLSEAGFPAPLR